MLVMAAAEPREILKLAAAPTGSVMYFRPISVKISVAAPSMSRVSHGVKRHRRYVLVLSAGVSEAPQRLRMAQPGAQPDEHEEAGRADIRLTVLHVGGDGAAQQPRDEEHHDRSSWRDQKQQRAQRLPGRDQHQLSLEAEPVQFRDDLRYLGELGAGAPDERESAQKDQNVACRAVPFHGLKTPSPRLVYNCHTSRPRVTMITGT